MTSKSLTVLVIGGGVAGLAVAHLLHTKGKAAEIPVNVSVYELRGGPTTIGGAISIAPNALRILDKQMGIYQKLRPMGCDDVKTCELFSASSGKSLGNFA